MTKDLYFNLFLEGLKSSKKKNLLSLLTFYVTNRCNSKCKGCFYWKELNKPTSELSLEEIKKISRYLGNFSFLRITGGEPFLRDDLHDICSLFVKQNRVENISIATNGLLSRKIIVNTLNIIKKCEGTDINLRLPLDGLRKTNDILRGTKGSFDKVLKTLLLLNKIKKEQDLSNLNFYINTTVSNKNYKEIAALFDFIAKQNFDLSQHHAIPLCGSIKDKSLRPPNKNEWLKLYQKIKKIKECYFIKNKTKSKLFLHRFKEKVINKWIANSLDYKKWPTKCIAGDRIGVLESEGSVRLCELTQRIGNARDFNYNFKKVWLSKNAQKIRKKLKDCSCTNICALGPSLAYGASNPLFIFKSIFK